jgi:site-specific DNA-methyltransferase (cytosine-N4-specific)
MLSPSSPKALRFQFGQSPHPCELVPGFPPYYHTDQGAAYLGDSLDVLKAIPSGSVNLVFTSPPYALHFKKEYGNVHRDQYVDWFLAFAREIHRTLAEDGSFVLNIGGTWNPGVPTKSLYQYKLLVALVEEIEFHLAQECFWYNPAKMPVPTEWVAVRRIRVKDAVENVWWLSKTPWPKADNRRVLRPYSRDILRLNERGVKTAVRPSVHNIKEAFGDISAGGSIAPNVFEDASPTNFLKLGNSASNDPYTKRCKEAGIKIHPARFPAAMPEFFLKMLTDEDDVLLDPFAGSNTAGAVAESLGRRWIAVEMLEEYLAGSKFRFDLA